MPDKHLLNASSRVALAAFLHDLGKFAERARIEEAHQKDTDGNQRRDLNVQLYCPKYNERHTHIHAAYTAIGFDLLEQHMPDLVGDDMTPFKPWKDRDADDSLINAAAMHHKPGTFLQWVIATADRVASGFEREKFEDYNKLADDEKAKLNHYTTRQLTLLEQIRLDGKPPKKEDLKYRYALKPLTVDSLFPQKKEQCEPEGNNTKAQAEYKALWQDFREALTKIPDAHRKNLPLWLDHFDTLWQVYAHAIPAATVSPMNQNIKADVSLYDHSKTTAALAVGLWRYHQETGQETGKLEDWDTNKFLLIQGDFFGIQDFIFASGGETRKRAAKLLRGRSFYVSLLMECAALKIMDVLGLPSTSQVTNAAGKFLIVAPNTPDTIQKLEKVQHELNQWFIDHTFGQSGVGLAWLPAACNDFTQGKFSDLMKRLFEQLEKVKLRRFDLCATQAPMVFDEFLDAFDNNKTVCAIDGRSPGIVALEDKWISRLAADQIKVGQYLTGFKRLLITRDDLNHNTLKLPIFGFHVSFTKSEDITGKFGQLARQANLLRAFDFSLPDTADKALWKGYARRAINAWIPRFTKADFDTFDKYTDTDEIYEKTEGETKTLNHLADEDQWMDEKGDWIGISALMTLKGDVDNLGIIFQRGIGAPSFAKMAALSRQMNAFFSIWLPYLCQKEFPNTYTVFAGGDDFFLIGPWRSTMKLAQRMQVEFKRYVGENPDVHFSAGLSITKPGLPINYLADMAEAALDKAKSYNFDPKKDKAAPKNAVTCFGHSASWEHFNDLLECAEQLNVIRKDFDLSTGYLYGLLNLTSLAEDRSKPANAVWHSRFAYRTYRMLETRRRDGRKLDETERRRLQAELSLAIANQGIEKHKGNYRIALFTHIYQHRR
ncbi:type III-A CRISPR-associated protein Cas10/Csm1 [Thiothrix winogradskyi]|uniref:CRISPR system single-strand-specific deoxyribonuclease Cas10/Csm1 (subtype III-A) n=1 Tax=Thiothrix winogradskyi TaxID=96472 RepID=A0ABY3T3W1_9GAMM|nr:type III-A CRISPR-associated protein Cas10/Csm1 [Thiothrix winogradskyi]UJS25962.1 type III-A CRISPR-associated protein Cas10/Csm1 [Thiothrix winogradskyi]